MILDSTDKSLDIEPIDATASVDPTFSADYVESYAGAFVPKANDGVVSGTPVVAVPAPAAARFHLVRGLTLFNRDNYERRFRVQLNNNTVKSTRWGGKLAAGECLIYTPHQGFQRHAAHGMPYRLYRSVPIGTRRGVELASEQRVMRSQLTGQGTLLGVTDTAYWVYVGYATQDLIVKYVELHVSTAGAGAQTAEVWIASSVSPPNKVGQTVTVMAASSVVDALTSAGAKRNTIPFMYTVPRGTHLWAGVRTAMATTQPTYRALGFDMSQGAVLQTASPGVIVAPNGYGCSLVTPSANHDTPDLRVVLD